MVGDVITGKDLNAKNNNISQKKQQEPRPWADMG